METYYFTYGSEGHPYYGGWTEITAPDHASACALFRAVHPDKISGVLNCAFVYGEDEFKKNRMYRLGNFGFFCHEQISVIVIKEEDL